MYWYKGHGYGMRLLNSNMLSNLVGIHSSSSSSSIGNCITSTHLDEAKTANNSTMISSSPQSTSSSGAIVFLIGCSTMRHATTSPCSAQPPYSAPFPCTPTPLINIPSSILGGTIIRGVERPMKMVLGSLWTIMDRQSDSFSTRIMTHAMTTTTPHHQKQKHRPCPEEKEEDDEGDDDDGGSSIASAIGAARLWVLQAPHLTPLTARRKLTIEASSPYVNAGVFVIYGLPATL